jgi:outer membrane murein-binding lipoprotein Lpp
MNAIDLINAVGLPLAALLLVTGAFLSRRIVTRGEYDEVKAQRDRLETELRATRDDLRRTNEILARAMEQLTNRPRRSA